MQHMSVANDAIDSGRKRLPRAAMLCSGRTDYLSLQDILSVHHAPTNG